MALTSFVEEEKVHAALDAGASGFLLKDAEADEVAAAVRAAHRGEVHLDPAVAGRLVRSMRTRQQGPTGPDAAIEPGTVLARTARWRMRGSIKVGGRWLRFRAWQVESPHRGFLWAARAGGAIVASDRYINGTGGMDWRLFGLFRVAHADGPDVSRSAAGRAGAEAIWVPTALLPRQGVSWAALDDRSLRAAYRLDDTDIQLQLTLDPHGRLQSGVFDRWGDPDNAGKWGYHPFGFEVDRACHLSWPYPSGHRAGRLVLRHGPLGPRSVLPQRDHPLPAPHIGCPIADKPNALPVGSTGPARPRWYASPQV